MCEYVSSLPWGHSKSVSDAHATKRLCRHISVATDTRIHTPTYKHKLTRIYSHSHSQRRQIKMSAESKGKQIGIEISKYQ